MTEPDYTALVVSRICHDLVSPLGAIANGVELLSMAGAGPELSLIAESVANANARIRMFRIAFGLAERGQRVTRGELATLVSDLSTAGRMTLHWPVASDIERREAKLVLLAVQCLETLMPWGADIAVSQDSGRTAVEGRAARMRDMPDLLSRLTAGARGDAPDVDAPDAAQVQFRFLPREAAAQGRRLAVDEVQGGLRLTF